MLSKVCLIQKKEYGVRMIKIWLKSLGYFDNLFLSTNPAQVDIEQITEAVEGVVDDQMNVFLCAPFTREDRSIKAHQDPWIPELPAFKSRINSEVSSNIKVAQYIQSDGIWNENAVRLDFPTDIAEAILNITLSRRDSEDIRYWKGSKDEKYSVKAGYFLEIQSAAPPPYQSSHPLRDWWKLFGSLTFHPRYAYLYGVLREILSRLQ